MNDFIAGIIVGSLVIGSAVYKVNNSFYASKEISCAKEHNVYECELIAVPKEVKP